MVKDSDSKILRSYPALLCETNNKRIGIIIKNNTMHLISRMTLVKFHSMLKSTSAIFIGLSKNLLKTSNMLLNCEKNHRVQPWKFAGYIIPG